MIVCAGHGREGAVSVLCFRVRLRSVFLMVAFWSLSLPDSILDTARPSRFFKVLSSFRSFCRSQSPRGPSLLRSLYFVVRTPYVRGGGSFPRLFLVLAPEPRREFF